MTDDTEVGRPAAEDPAASGTGADGARGAATGRVTIREARPEELLAVGEIRVAAFVGGGFLSPDSAYTPRLRALGTGGDGMVLVAIARDGDQHGSGYPAAGGRMVGTVMVRADPQASEIGRPGEAEIRGLAVLPGTQGMGIGRALLQAALGRAGRLGARSVVLSTQPDMRAARRLYELAGFTRQPDRDWVPEPGVTLLVYARPLPANAF